MSPFSRDGHLSGDDGLLILLVTAFIIFILLI